jgi:hypothetical protein
MNRREAIQRFTYLQDKFPYLGDTVILGKLIRGKKYTTELIAKLYRFTIKEELTRKTKTELLHWYSTI